MITFLEWDTGFFGFKTGCATDLDVKDYSYLKIKQAIAEQGYRLVYFYVPDVHLEERKKASQGFIAIMNEASAALVDNKLVFRKPANKEKAFYHPGVSRFEETAITGELQSLAIQAGAYSRFQRDPQFPVPLFEKLYLEWIHNSIRGSMGDEVLVWKDEKELIRGFVSIKHHCEHSSIGLIAVDEAFRGRHLGSLLLQAAEASCIANGRKFLEVATQTDNIPACRFYEKYGFNQSAITSVYHWWQ